MCMGACLLKYMIESYVTCKFKKKAEENMYIIENWVKPT